MRAHRVRVEVLADHEVRVTLPNDFPVGAAEVIVVVAKRSEESRTRGRLSVDQLLAARLTPPEGVGPVSLADMDRAIAAGASGHGSV